MHGHADLGGGAEVGVVDGDDHLVALQLLVNELLFGLDDRFDRVVVGRELAHEVVALPLLDRVTLTVRHQRVDLDRDQALELFRWDGLEAEDLVDRLLWREATHHAEVHVAVGALEDHRLVNAGRIRLRHQAVVRGVAVFGHLPDLRGVQPHALEQARLHVLPASRLLARVQRGKDSRRDEPDHPAARHGHGQEDRPGTPARLIPLLSARCGHEGVVTGTVLIAVTDRVRGNGAGDEARVRGPQGVGPDPEAIHHAGGEAVDDDVGGGREREERVASGVGLEVRGDRTARAASTPCSRRNPGTDHLREARP